MTNEQLESKIEELAVVMVCDDCAYNEKAANAWLSETRKYARTFVTELLVQAYEEAIQIARPYTDDGPGTDHTGGESVAQTIVDELRALKDQLASEKVTA